MRTTTLLALLVLLLVGCETQEPAPAFSVTYPPIPPETVDPFLDELQERTFRWFWEMTPAETGLTPDRAPNLTFSSVAAIGFGLTANGIGAERGYVTREQALERTLTTLRYLWSRPTGPDDFGKSGYKGFYYHFLEFDTGERFRQTELSTIDTALLMLGVLFSQSYFDGSSADEQEVRALADSLYRRVEWDWALQRKTLIAMGWYPHVGWGPPDYEGYNEAQFLYLLALGSPTYPVPASSWDDFTESYLWEDFYGYEHINFSPLFGHQYTASWIDLRGIQDDYMRGKGIDYHENSRRATLAQRAYAIDNPNDWTGYGENLWGLTACDGPIGLTREVRGTERRFMTYSARGASAEEIRDDGTIAPTAAGGSIPFAPDETIAALKNMRDQYGDALFTEYGFLDSFNPTFTFEDVTLRHGRVVPGLGWINGDYLGIDQGPILLMAENYRSGFVWEVMKKNPYIVQGLQRAGFQGGWLEGLPGPEPVTVRDYRSIQAEEEAGSGPAIVVLGSSTAAGTGPKQRENTWVNRYRTYVQSQYPDARVINLARGGFSTYNILPTGTPQREGRGRVDDRRNITRAIEKNPVAIIINLPSNDAAYGHSVEEQLANYDVILAEAEAANIPVWITTTNPRDLGMDDAKVQIQLAMRDSTMARWGDRAINTFDDLAKPDGYLRPEYNSGDHVHLTDEAHRLIFERVRDARIAEQVFND